MGKFKYPVIVSRHLYVTEVGGRSNSLRKDQVGLHVEAILFKTRLSAGDEVLVDPESTTSCPLFARDIRRVEPITDFHNTRLLAMASDGEAILSDDDPMDVELGEKIILNAAVNRLPKDWKEKIICKHVEDRTSKSNS